MCAGSDVDMKKWIMSMTDAIKGSSGSVCIFIGKKNGIKSKLVRLKPVLVSGFHSDHAL